MTMLLKPSKLSKSSFSSLFNVYKSKCLSSFSKGIIIKVEFTKT